MEELRMLDIGSSEPPLKYMAFRGEEDQPGIVDHVTIPYRLTPNSVGQVILLSRPYGDNAIKVIVWEFNDSEEIKHLPLLHTSGSMQKLPRNLNEVKVLDFNGSLRDGSGKFRYVFACFRSLEKSIEWFNSCSPEQISDLALSAEAYLQLLAPLRTIS